MRGRDPSNHSKGAAQKDGENYEWEACSELEIMEIKENIAEILKNRQEIWTNLIAQVKKVFSNRISIS